MYPVSPQNLTLTKNEVSYGRNIVALQWNPIPSDKEYTLILRQITESNGYSYHPLKERTSSNSHVFNGGITPCTNYEVEVLINFENSTYSKRTLEFETAMQSQY